MAVSTDFAAQRFNFGNNRRVLLLLVPQIIPRQSNFLADPRRGQQVRISQLVIVPSKIVGLNPTLLNEGSQDIVRFTEADTQLPCKITLGKPWGSLDQFQQLEMRSCSSGHRYVRSTIERTEFYAPSKTKANTPLLNPNEHGMPGISRESPELLGLRNRAFHSPRSGVKRERSRKPHLEHLFLRVLAAD